MTSAKEQEYFESDLQKLNCDIQDDVKYMEQDSSNIEDDVSHSDIEGNIIMDADGNYYYQSPKSMVKVEPLPKISGAPIKKVAAAVIPQTKRRTTADAAPSSAKKSKIEINEVKILKLDDGAAKNADETISSEFGKQEKVYEFDENEQDPDDPQELPDPDYQTKGIIKKAKKSTANDTTSFNCMICSYQTHKKFLLSRHLKTHCDERPYKCDVCERGFKTNAALMNHRNIHLGRKPHACASCDMAFTTSGELVRHVRYRHTHIKPHKCTECDYSSVEMSKLRRHMRCHTGERPYQCPHCTYASPDTFKLKRHMRIHTGEKPYECDICHARFTQSNSLKHHRLIHSVSEKPVFQCNLCPTTCGRKTDLRLHIKNLHNSDQPLPCKRCGKELPDRYAYKMHIKTHEGEKCFRCEYCPYASISQRHLESHVLIHLDAKPFVCNICTTSFRQKQLLARHMKIYHSDNYEPPKQRRKDHKCPHCNKMFAFNGNLIRHMEIHDPDSQRIEKIDELKMGRLKRVISDGTDVTVSSSSKFAKLFDDNEELFYDETEEKQQIEGEEIQEEVFEEAEVYNEANIEYVYDEYESDEYEDQIEEVQYEEQQQETNQKTILIEVKEEPNLVQQPSLTNDIIVKVEHKPDSEILDLEDLDDQGFMVIEVLSDDEDNDDQQQDVHQQNVQQAQNGEIKPIIINKKAYSSPNKNLRKNSQSLISDYFGFEVNAEDEDEETKGAIKILEMIDRE